MHDADMCMSRQLNYPFLSLTKGQQEVSLELSSNRRQVYLHEISVSQIEREHKKRKLLMLLLTLFSLLSFDKTGLICHRSHDVSMRLIQRNFPSLFFPQVFSDSLYSEANLIPRIKLALYGCSFQASHFIFSLLVLQFALFTNLLPLPLNLIITVCAFYFFHFN